VLSESLFKFRAPKGVDVVDNSGGDLPMSDRGK